MNEDIAKIFYEIALYLEMDDVPFKPQAYEKAAQLIEGLPQDIEEIYKKEGSEGLEKLPGIGKNIGEKIAEYIKTGKIKEYENLKKKIPVDISELKRVEGLGPKKIKVLYKKLKIRNLKELEKAARAHKIAPLFGFGEKTEINILEGIAFLKKSAGRFLLGDILPSARKIYEKLKNLKEVKQISFAGSLRRMKETIGDVDILIVSSQPKKVMDYFVSLPGIIKIWGRGATKSSVRMKQGFDVDVRVVPEKSFGSALQYFTGSKEHNIATRKMAIEKGFKLNEYGIETEEKVYKRLGLPYIEPELRENTGEIEAALKGQLPKLIKLENIRGDLHAHCDWDGGENSIEEIAVEARKRGYEYIGIADHTKFLRIEHGLDEKQLLARNKEIDKINLKIKNWKLRILKGCEANILSDGSIDIDDKVLAQMDFVIAGVHSQFKMPRGKMTERIIKAMRNPNVDIISHPTGRIINRRDEYQIDFDKILKAARETETILEINASPYRLDLKDSYIKKAKEKGVKMIINTDAHNLEQLGLMEYGVSQARRGWAEREDIINCWPLEKFLSSMKSAEGRGQK
jgi:DNA polymerase (family 10)